MLNEMLSAKTSRVMPRITCGNGLTLSVQANSCAYCEPREDTGPWQSVEVGFPSRAIPALMDYCEDATRPTQTVYAYVPVSLVEQVIADNGGLA